MSLDYNVSVVMAAGVGLDGTFNVKSYGAVGDGATDDTVAIQAAGVAAAAAGGVLFLPAGAFAIGSATVIPSGCDVVMDGCLHYTGAINTVALTIGEAGTPNSRRNIQVCLTRSAEVDWTSDTSVGVRFYNSTTCKIDIRHIQYFTVGAQFYGDAGGFAYNQVSFGHFERCQTSVECTNANFGWCNQNEYFGGRISGPSAGLNISNARTGIKITSSDASYVVNNNNTFYSPSIELSQPATTGVPTPVHIEHGTMNEIIGMRSEQKALPDSDIVLVENGSSRNVVGIGYDNATGVSANYTDTSDSQSTIVRYRRLETNEDTLSVWNSGSLAEKAYEYDGSGSVAVRGMHIAASGSATINRANTGVTVANGSLTMTTNNRSVGVFIATGSQKRFLVRRSVPEGGNGGRVIVRCYDSSGTIIVDPSGGGGTTYLKSLSHSPLTYFAADVGYKTGADSEWDVYFSLHDDVKYAAIDIGGGSTGATISSFSIETLDRPGSVSAWSGIGHPLTGGDHANVLSTEPPATAGTGIYYEQGTEIGNESAVSGVDTGWVCVTAGAPGTWAPKSGLTYTAKTSDYTLLASESGQVFSNLGATGTITLTLPTAVVGLNYKVQELAGQVINITPPAGVTVTYPTGAGSSTTATGVGVSSSSSGVNCEIIATSTTNWVIINSNLDWS